MNCNEVRDNLVAYLHGELDKKAVMEIHQHLGGCEACLQEEIELLQTHRLLDRFRFEALPADFDEKLHRKIQHVMPSPKTEKSDFRRIVYAVAATILIIFGIQFIGSRIFQTAQPSIHFNHFPTTHAVFKSVDIQPGSELSLKERLVQRYLTPVQSGKMKIERND